MITYIHIYIFLAICLLYNVTNKYYKFLFICYLYVIYTLFIRYLYVIGIHVCLKNICSTCSVSS